MANNTKLLPCPFCGVKARYINDAGWNKGVECRKCTHEIYFFKRGVNVTHGPNVDQKAEIAKRWNKRAGVK